MTLFCLYYPYMLEGVEPVIEDANEAHKLLDREQVGNKEASVDDEEEDGFLKAFKEKNYRYRAKFEYKEEEETVAEEETRKLAMENINTMNNSERTSYREELLQCKYEVQNVEELNALGKGKRSRKQMVSVEDDDLVGLEDVSSDGEDDNFEAELTDGDTISSGTQSVDSMEPIPLMEGEGKSFRVLGFSKSQRAAFVQIVMRFGVGDFDWKEFASRLKQKSYEEIKDYGVLFLTHIAEDLNDSPTFSDGVPKEGLRIPDVLVRIADLLLLSKKVKTASEQPGTPLFTNDIIMCYPALKGGKFWKEEHDLLLLSAVLKHGYGRWQAIVDDKELRIQEVICQELNLPFINLHVPGQAGYGVNASNAEFRGMRRKQVGYVKKRVLLLEKGLHAEYRKEYIRELNANEVPSEEPEVGQVVADMPSSSSS
ncbi:CYTOKININ-HYPERSENSITIVE 2, hypersensitive to red and blue 2, GYMNOS [Hibiscus trionum]|uniref:CYTOKININ-HYPERSENSITIVE 2, hypersensitive to red and blue 2, GYMNOS n=1 Tax=Hibiscus trionum TaxID=183268 RepID=A0A9W7MCB5_HIBTR|nr:CYTOKININ-HYPERSENSITIVE 2, hypersensitive to red and blue 2, GYMNOS [Hibiscus trionum]